MRSTDEKAALLRPANHGAIYVALVEADVLSLVVNFDGYGNGGQTEALDAGSADGEVALPDTRIEIASLIWSNADPCRSPRLLRPSPAALSAQDDVAAMISTSTNASGRASAATTMVVTAGGLSEAQRRRLTAPSV